MVQYFLHQPGVRILHLFIQISCSLQWHSKRSTPSLSNCYVDNIVHDPPTAVQAITGTLEGPSLPSVIGSFRLNRGLATVPKTPPVTLGMLYPQKSLSSLEIPPAGAITEAVTLGTLKYVATATRDEHWTIAGVKLGPSGADAIFIGGTSVSVGSHGALIVDGTASVDNFSVNIKSVTASHLAELTEWHVASLEIGSASRKSKQLQNIGSLEDIKDYLTS
jgi:hypothetical protein